MQDHRMETFLTVCETMNYRQAAERLHLTQPAVTQHIQSLESYYGCKLFSYDGRKLAKTEQAELLERRAHAINYQEARLRQDLRARQAPSLSIGATKTIGEFVIGEHVSRYLDVPGNRLSVDVDNTAHILERLNQGRLDFAIVEGYYSRSEYEDRLYQTDPFVGLCARDHPLAGQTVPLEGLWGEDLLLREKGSGTREILENFLNENNHAVTDFARVTCIGNLGLMGRLLERKQGITLAYAAAAAENSRLARFSVEGWELRREFNYVFLRDTGAKALVEFFESYRPQA